MRRDRLAQLRVRCRCGKVRPAEDSVCPDCYHRQKKQPAPRKPRKQEPDQG